jgi:hypothetical protein
MVPGPEVGFLVERLLAAKGLEATGLEGGETL